MKLEGKVALITGAAAGIGEATALLFAREGANVSVVDLNEKKGKEVVQAIKATGSDAIFVKGDVSKALDAEKMVRETVKAFGKLDILFNNAGIVVPGSIDTHTEEEWDKTMAVNVRGIFLVTKFAIPELKRTKGRIINTASSVSVKGVKNRAAYTASKGAVWSLTRAMAMDYLEDGIRVNAVCPGTTDTPSLAGRIAQNPDPEATRKDLMARQPLGRFGKPEEIAEAVLFLASNEFCTGSALPIDGGMTI